jgi:RNA polymerase-binding transcription factor DksA
MQSMVIVARRRLEEHRTALQQRLRAAASAEAELDLAETTAAIHRIELGKYGRCERCDAALGRQRLLALPAARYCMACAPVARRS